jgi:hypothetical protein
MRFNSAFKGLRNFISNSKKSNIGLTENLSSTLLSLIFSQVKTGQKEGDKSV